MNRRYFWLLTTADCVSTLGSQVGWLASVWLAGGHQNGAFWVCVLSVCFGLSSAIGSLLVGPWLQKLPTREAMIWANVVLAALSTLLATLQWSSCSIVYWAMALIVSGMIGPFTQLGWTILMPKLVPEDDLVKANSYSELAFQATGLCAPVVASVVISTTGPELAVLLDALTFIASAVLLWRLPTDVDANKKPHQGAKRSWWEEFLTGATWFVRHSTVFWLSLLACLMMFGAGVEDVTYPLMIEQQLHGPATWLGELLATYTVGLGLGAWGYSQFSKHFKGNWNPLLFVALWGACFAMYSLPKEITSFCILSGLAGLSFGAFPPLVRSTVQQLVPREVAGSVFGFRTMLLTLSVPLGAATAGHLITTNNFHPTSVIHWLGITAVVIAGMTILVLRRRPLIT